MSVALLLAMVISGSIIPLESELEISDLSSEDDFVDAIPMAPLRRQTNSPVSERHILHLADLFKGRIEWENKSVYNKLFRYPQNDAKYFRSLASDPEFEINSFLVYDRFSILICAVLYEDMKLIEELLKREDLDVNWMGGSDYRPIHFTLKNPELLDLFLNEARGLDLLAVDAFGNTVVDLAIIENHLESAEIILAKLSIFWLDLNTKERKMFRSLYKKLNSEKLQKHFEKLKIGKAKPD